MSKARDAERKRTERARKKAQGTALLPKSLVRKLRRLGISPTRYLLAPPVSPDAYRDLERQLRAKVQRIEWQSGGIRLLRQEIETLKARLAMLPAMQDAEVLQRLTQLEADQALHEAAHEAQEPQETKAEALHRLAHTLHPEWVRR